MEFSILNLEATISFRLDYSVPIQKVYFFLLLEEHQIKSLIILLIRAEV